MEKKTLYWTIGIIGTALAGVAGYFGYKELFPSKEKKAFDDNVHSRGDSLTPHTAEIIDPSKRKQFSFNYSEDPWDMRFLAEVQKKVPRGNARFLGEETADRYAKFIREANRYWDDEAGVYKIFTKDLQARVQVAEIAHAFHETYHKKGIDDLFLYMKDFMSAGRMKRIQDRIKTLPLF